MNIKGGTLALICDAITERKDKPTRLSRTSEEFCCPRLGGDRDFRINNKRIESSGNMRNGSPHPLTCNFLNQHDFITFFEDSLDRIFEICEPIYRQGRSLKEISILTGFPYTTIRDQLVKHGVTLRTNTAVTFQESLRQSTKGVAALPYGFCYLEGRPAKDSKEYSVLQIIHTHWQLGRTPTDIARHLNAKGFKTRHGKDWKQPTVFYILERFETKVVTMNELPPTADSEPHPKKPRSNRLRTSKSKIKTDDESHRIPNRRESPQNNKRK